MSSKSCFCFFIIFSGFSKFSLQSYNIISHYRPLMQGEQDLIDYHEYDDANSIWPSNFTYRIASGYRPTNDNLYHHVVSIRTRQPTAYFGDNHFCTGVVITSRIIITAAHCVVDGQRFVTRPKRLKVIAGSAYRLIRQTTTLELEVIQVIPHLKFQRRKGYDIALLVLADSLPRSNSKIKIISLAKQRPPVGTKCQTMGWGQLFWDGPYANRITYGNLSIASDSLCRQHYGKRFTSDLLCVANPDDPYADACRGDSGAPLICHKKLVGIVSYSSMCSDQKPTTFTDITQYLEWIFTMEAGVQNLPSMKILLILFLVLWTF